MRELPMLLNGEMVRATLDGCKTMTRRPVKFLKIAYRPSLDWIGSVNPDGRDGWIAWGPHSVTDARSREAYPDGGGFRNPLGVPGDLLYVRETHTWITLAENEYNPENPCHKRHPRGYPVMMIYRAEGVEIASCWRPSIHMPKWAARTWVVNTGVRVERVRDITEDDVIAEGIRLVEEVAPDLSRSKVYFESDAGRSTCPFEAYAWLWYSIYAKRGLGWDPNPWVFVTSYEVTER